MHTSGFHCRGADLGWNMARKVLAVCLGQWDLLVEWDVGFILDPSLMYQSNEFAMFCGYIALVE